MKKNTIIFVLLIFLSSMIIAEKSNTKDIWEHFRFLEGKWSMEKPGLSKIQQEHRFLFNEKFIESRTYAKFEPTQKKPKGEIHEDLAIISYNSASKKYNMRAYYSEGFVNHFYLESVLKNGKLLVFITEEIENAPPGTKAKLTFENISENEMIEKFYIAWPNKELKCIITNNFKKIQDNN